METRTADWRRLLLPVGFALLCVVLTIFVWKSFGGSTPFQATGYRVSMPLQQASNLFPGADVRIAGVNVGKVKAVQQDGRGARAQLELQPKYAPLHRGANAILRTKTLLGETFIELNPGRADAPIIREGGTLTAAEVQPAQRLDDVLSAFGPRTRSSLRNLLGGMARSLHGRAGDLSATLADAGPLATNAQTVVDVLDEQRPALQQLIANSGDILAAAGGRARPLRAAVTAGDRLLDVTARRNRELGATIDALPPFLHQLQTTATTLGGFSSDLNAATTALEPVAPQLLPTFASVQTAAPVFRSLFARLPGVIAAGRRGLPAVGHILRVLPSSLRDIDGLARELIPFLDLLGASRRSVVGTFANVGQIQNGSMIGPGGKVIHYGNGLPTIWNETLGGWVKRLPSNRQNPYPKPNSALDIARGGLKAYDCRNTGNENYLAPTGSGAPPCLTQGPWEFRGETRTFPHLTLRPR